MSERCEVCDLRATKPELATIHFRHCPHCGTEWRPGHSGTAAVVGWKEQ